MRWAPNRSKDHNYLCFALPFRPCDELPFFALTRFIVELEGTVLIETVDFAKLKVGLLLTRVNLLEMGASPDLRTILHRRSHR